MPPASPPLPARPGAGLRRAGLLALALAAMGCSARPAAPSTPPPLPPAPLPPTATAPSLPGVAPLPLAWRYAADRPLAASVAAGQGLVFLAPGGETVVALDGAGGWERWRYPGPVHPRSLVVGGELLLAGAPGGRLLALEAATGALRWGVTLTGEVVYPPTPAGGRVYVGTSFVGPGLEPQPERRGWLYALDLADGRVLWARETVAYLLASPVVGQDRLLAGGSFLGGATEEGGHLRLMALAPEDGRVLWQRDSEDGLLKSLALDESRAYYLAYRDVLYALDLSSGDLLWKYNTENWSPGFALAGGVLYFGSDNGFVHAVRGEDGARLWRVHLEGVFNAPRSRPLVEGERLYFQSNDQALYALDRATGAILWRTPPQPRSRVGLTLGEGRLYLVGVDNAVYAYAPAAPPTPPHRDTPR